MGKVKVIVRNSQNNKVVSEFSYEGSLDELKEVMSARMKDHPMSFENANRLRVEANDNGTIANMSINNMSWWKPSQPKNSRFITINVNGSRTKLKVPNEIFNSPDYMDRAMDFAKEWILRSYQNNFPKGTMITFGVDVELGNGKIEGSRGFVEVGQNKDDEREM